jgi:hypothetical protein
MLRQADWLCQLVWCRSCHHQAPADLQALVDAGRGDVPVIGAALPLHGLRHSAYRLGRDGQSAYACSLGTEGSVSSTSHAPSLIPSSVDWTL